MKASAFVTIRSEVQKRTSCEFKITKASFQCSLLSLNGRLGHARMFS